MRTVMKWVLAAWLGVPAAGSGQAAQSEWQERAESLVRDLEAGRYGAAVEKMAPAVRAQLDSARLSAAWSQVTTAAGKLQSLEPRTDTVQDGMHVVEFDAAFERQTLLVRVVMLTDGQVAGLWFLPPTGGGGGAMAGRDAEGPPKTDPSRIEGPGELPGADASSKGGARRESGGQRSTRVTRPILFDSLEPYLPE